MMENNVSIALIQETRIGQNTREARKNYTWYFSGENGRPEYTAGVAIVIKNKMIKHMEDIEPINDRLMTMKLKGTLQIKIINTYIPQAKRPGEEKDTAYQKLRKSKNTQKIKDQLT